MEEEELKEKIKESVDKISKIDILKYIEVIINDILEELE